jgi:hypothetical protein
MTTCLHVDLRKVDDTLRVFSAGHISPRLAAAHIVAVLIPFNDNLGATHYRERAAAWLHQILAERQGCGAGDLAREVSLLCEKDQAAKEELGGIAGRLYAPENEIRVT